MAYVITETLHWRQGQLLRRGVTWRCGDRLDGLTLQSLRSGAWSPLPSSTIHASSPFAHGAWLVAYLALVGFLAQALLGAGQSALLTEALCPPSA